MGMIHDIKDERNIEIENVGICDYKLPITFCSDKEYNTIASISAGVSLGSSIKGAHLSRIIETLDEMLANNKITLDYFKKVLEELKHKLEVGNSRLNMGFDIVFNTTTPVSGKKTFLNSHIILNGDTNDEINNYISVTSTGAMLCPNSKAISKYGAHSQKCNLTASLYGNISEVKIEDITNIVFRQFSAEVYGVVKSSDEKILTEKAYENPKFSEDLVRDTLLALREYYKVGKIKVEIENLESIHQHNVYARGLLR